MTPQEIVSELDRHIVGQGKAKRAVAIALRNRWRRQQVEESMRAEITPKNILMIGPTGVGKTEIARRLAKLADAPFIKVEATKFTEVGYVGKDVDTIIRDLADMAVKQERENAMRGQRARAEDAAEDRILDILVPPARAEFGLTPTTTPDNTARQVMRKRLREGTLDDKEIDVEVADPKPALEIMGPAGMEDMTEQLKGLFANLGGARKKTRKLRIGEARKLLIEEEAGKLVNDDEIKTRALANAEQNGIVFIDEIDKVTSRSESSGSADVSRQGVQRDLLPLVEGTTVNTKYGMVKTDHILFIASGAFHLSKPSDLIPELQGRFPIRVELALARRRRLRGDPDADPRQPGQAVHPAARDRRRSPRLQGRCDPPHRADRLRRQRAHREHRRAAPVDGDGTPARRRQLRRAESRRPDRRARRRRGRRQAVGAGAQRGSVALHPLRQARASRRASSAPLTAATARAGATAAAAGPRRSACRRSRSRGRGSAPA